MKTRRKLHFDSLQKAMEEAEYLAHTRVTTSGNFSLGQILEHLARALELAMGTGQALHVPVIGRIFGRLIRKWIINGPPRPGFRLPKKGQSLLWPDGEVSTSEALRHLQDTMESFLRLDDYPPHPLFGKMDLENSRAIQCRHFELHLGFVHPVQERTSSFGEQQA